jgi:hypothetical protein
MIEKTLQELVDEQKTISPLNGKSARSIAATLRGVSDETKERMSVSRVGKPSWKKGLSTPIETVEKLKGKVPWNKDKSGSQIAWNKGKKTGPAANKDVSIYYYIGSKGQFNNISELMTAYPEYSRSYLYVSCRSNKNGFSRRLK